MERKEAVGIVAVAVGLVVGVACVVVGTTGILDRQGTVTERVPTDDGDTYVLPDTVRILTPCAEEDSHNCYWDAATMGNGTGTSFVDIDGVLYFPEMR